MCIFWGANSDGPFASLGVVASFKGEWSGGLGGVDNMMRVR